MSQRSPRFEWISLVYLAFFVLAVLSPSLVKERWFGIEERHLEEILIFIFGIVGFTIFSVYQRIMENHEREHENAKGEYERARRELSESYKYIGAINRQIEVLKRISNETSLNIVESEHLAKDLLASLVASAATSVGSTTAFVRYVELAKLRTDYEFYHPPESERGLKISNKDLLAVHEAGSTHAFLRTEDGRSLLVVPSDRKSKRIKAYLMVLLPNGETEDVDPSLLKVFANQAELLRHTLSRASHNGDPLEMIKETALQSQGEVV